LKNLKNKVLILKEKEKHFKKKEKNCKFNLEKLREKTKKERIKI